MNIDIKELRELLTLLNEDGVDGFMYVVFRGKDSASTREFGNIYPQNVQITKPLSDEEIEEVFYRLSMESNLFDFARAIEERHGIK